MWFNISSVTISHNCDFICHNRGFISQLLLNNNSQNWLYFAIVHIFQLFLIMVFFFNLTTWHLISHNLTIFLILNFSRLPFYFLTQKLASIHMWHFIYQASSSLSSPTWRIGDFASNIQDKYQLRVGVIIKYMLYLLCVLYNVMYLLLSSSLSLLFFIEKVKALSPMCETWECSKWESYYTHTHTHAAGEGQGLFFSRPGGQTTSMC